MLSFIGAIIVFGFGWFGGYWHGKGTLGAHWSALTTWIKARFKKKVTPAASVQASTTKTPIQ